MHTSNKSQFRVIPNIFKSFQVCLVAMIFIWSQSFGKLSPKNSKFF